jgi:hypothetical protein
MQEVKRSISRSRNIKEYALKAWTEPSVSANELGGNCFSYPPCGGYSGLPWTLPDFAQ